MKHKITFFIVLTALFCVQVAFTQNRIQKIDSLLTASYKSDLFNGSVLIAEKGKVIYKKSFGYSNESTREKLNENSIFELASISKTFTAMGIVILKEQGKLSYEDKLAKYIPELSFYKNITIRHLLHHTSGIDDYQYLMDSLYDKTKIVDNKIMIDFFVKHQPKLLFEPNTKWEYSNTGYALLASIIEKVSGMKYGDFLDKTIFKPLKMTNTLVYTRRYAPQTVKNYAYGYVYNPSMKKYVLPDSLENTKFVIWLDGIVGDGTVNSSTIDLYKWDRALTEKKLISKESYDEIFQPGILADSTKTNYGFGWQINYNKTNYYGKKLFHGGGWPGYKNMMSRYIDDDKVIIILTNHNLSFPTKKISDILYNRPEYKIIKLSPKAAEALVGIYKNDEGNNREIVYSDNKLYRMAGMQRVEFQPLSETKFIFNANDEDVFCEFIFEEGKVTKYILTRSDKSVIGTAIKSPKKKLAQSFGLQLEIHNVDIAFARLIEMVNDTVNYELDENELNEMAYEFYNNGKKDYAFQTLRAAIYLFPNSDNLFNSYGELLVKSGKKEEAIIMYKKSLLLNPKNEDSKMNLEKLEQK
jgi:CubicO group peptidase (beta-lactamase class C family)